MDKRRWISPSETAALLGMHIQSIYVLIARGVIPAARVGRKVLVDRHLLEKELEQQAQDVSRARR
jgi:excisionase family DNA binding protein